MVYTIDGRALVALWLNWKNAPASGTFKSRMTTLAVRAGCCSRWLRMPVRARILDDIRVLPELGHLGVLEVGSEVEETLRLESRRGAAFSVENAEHDSDDVTVARLERVSPRVWVCVLGCRVASEGEISVPVLFHIQYESGGQSEVPVAIRWRGVGAE